MQEKSEADTVRSPSGFHQLGVTLARRRRRVFGAWLVAVVGALAFIPNFLGGLTGMSLEVNGSESAQAQELVQREFADAPTEQDMLVFHSDRYRASDPRFRRVVEDATANVRDESHVTQVLSPYEPRARGRVASGGHTAIAVLGWGGTQTELQHAAAGLQDTARAAATDRVDVYLTGTSPLMAALVEQENADIARAEAIGLPVALAVLLVAFGSAVAAGVPLLLGMLGLLVAFGLLGVASFVTSFGIFVESAVTMIGLALGIDYSLFLVSRYREELGARGPGPEAVGATMATAGKAVLFSGTTVCVSVAGLFLVPAPVFRGLATGVMVATAVMLVVTLTLLPALLGALGPRVNRLALPGLRGTLQHPDPERGPWARWARVVMRRAGVFALPTVAVLLALSYPLLDLRLGVNLEQSNLRHLPAGKGNQIVSESFAPGAVSPTRIVVRSPDGPLGGSDLTAIHRLTSQVRQDPEVAGVSSMTRALRRATGTPTPERPRAALERLGARSGSALFLNSEGGSDTTVLTAFPRTAPDSGTALELVQRLRDTTIPGALDGTGLRASVGGLSAQTADINQVTRAYTPLVIAVVLATSLLLLLLAFRSVVLPIKAILMNLLSIGTAYGLLVLIFQQGAGEAALDFDSPGYLQVYLPLLTFAVLFGLSMDYEVFLISRMKEEWERRRDNAAAVAAGLSHTAKVVSAAAAIMVTIFASFLVTSILEMKQMGFALAVAVLVDATVIRLLLVPSLMRLLGRANWWLPRGLDRALPRVELAEGAPGDGDGGCVPRADPAASRSGEA